MQAQAASDEADNYAKAGAIAEEVISNIKTVVAFGGEQKEMTRFQIELKKTMKSGLKRNIVSGLSFGVMWVTTFITYALLLWTGIRLMLDPDENYDVIALSAVILNIMGAFRSFGRATHFSEALAMARGSARRVFAIIDRKPMMDIISENGLKPESIDWNIEFKNVIFNYPSRSEVEVLQNVNFTVNKGETVALVGHSGCGKSTVIQLMQRFYDPQNGQILVDGHDLKCLNLSWFRNQIAVVNQEPILFATTIKENILIGNPSSDLAQVIEAAKDANCHDFISLLPDGYETLVGENGTQLSGGQKQRVAIARALIKNPKLLLLDEATSALDNNSESLVQKALDKASQGRTTFIVAHRLTTIKNAQKIIVFENGQVVETGTHDKLLEKKGKNC